MKIQCMERRAATRAVLLSRRETGWTSWHGQVKIKDVINDVHLFYRTAGAAVRPRHHLNKHSQVSKCENIVIENVLRFLRGCQSFREGDRVSRKVIYDVVRDLD